MIDTSKITLLSDSLAARADQIYTAEYARLPTVDEGPAPSAPSSNEDDESVETEKGVVTIETVDEQHMPPQGGSLPSSSNVVLSSNSDDDDNANSNVEDGNGGNGDIGGNTANTDCD